MSSKTKDLIAVLDEKFDEALQDVFGRNSFLSFKEMLDQLEVHHGIPPTFSLAMLQHSIHGSSLKINNPFVDSITPRPSSEELSPTVCESLEEIQTQPRPASPPHGHVESSKNEISSSSYHPVPSESTSESTSASLSPADGTPGHKHEFHQAAQRNPENLEATTSSGLTNVFVTQNGPEQARLTPSPAARKEPTPPPPGLHVQSVNMARRIKGILEKSGSGWMRICTEREFEIFYQDQFGNSFVDDMQNVLGITWVKEMVESRERLAYFCEQNGIGCQEYNGYMGGDFELFFYDYEKDDLCGMPELLFEQLSEENKYELRQKYDEEIEKLLEANYHTPLPDYRYFCWLLSVDTVEQVVEFYGDNYNSSVSSMNSEFQAGLEFQKPDLTPFREIRKEKYPFRAIRDTLNVDSNGEINFSVCLRTPEEILKRGSKMQLFYSGNKQRGASLVSEQVESARIIQNTPVVFLSNEHGFQRAYIDRLDLQQEPQAAYIKFIDIMNRGAHLVKLTEIALLDERFCQSPDIVNVICDGQEHPSDDETIDPEEVQSHVETKLNPMFIAKKCFAHLIFVNNRLWISDIDTDSNIEISIPDQRLYWYKDSKYKQLISRKTKIKHDEEHVEIPSQFADRVPPRVESYGDGYQSDAPTISSRRSVRDPLTINVLNRIRQPRR